MAWKDNLAGYLTCTRKDRVAVLVILLLLSAVFLLPKIIADGNAVNPVNNDTTWIAALNKLELAQKQPDDKFPENDYPVSYYQYDRNKNNRYTREEARLFYFDPNTLTADGWSTLGLRQKTILTIQHYLNKGGRFKKPEDVKRIYGLFPDEYERIAPYIRIAGDNHSTAETPAEPAADKPAKPYTPRYAVIDINTADTTALISLPGIGSKLSARIVNFRDKLGGFYSISQVAETFGLPDSTFQKIKAYLKLDNPSLKKININNATVDELKAHPYIRYAIANPLVAYRKEHGPFAKMEDIKKVMAVTEEIYSKIMPYLTL